MFQNFINNMLFQFMSLNSYRLFKDKSSYAFQYSKIWIKNSKLDITKAEIHFNKNLSQHFILVRIQLWTNEKVKKKNRMKYLLLTQNLIWRQFKLYQNEFFMTQNLHNYMTVVKKALKCFIKFNYKLFPNKFA